MSKVQNRAFVGGKQVRLDAELLSLVGKTAAQCEGVVEVGWKKRVGKVNYRSAKAALRGGTLLFEIYRDSVKAYCAAVPLEGSDVVEDNSSIIVLRCHENGSNYLWIRFGSGEMMKEWSTRLSAAARPTVSLRDFEVIRAVGKGGMGKVFLARQRQTGERLALKVVDKNSVFGREGHLSHMVDERLLLEMGSNHPFVLKLRYAFQSEANFYLATEFCEGGDLYHLLKRRRRTLNEEGARLVSSEVILALESMHKKGCVYRDLKPDNVLLDKDGHIRLADFGLAKLLKGAPDRYERTNSFCGTAQYTPPEMIQQRYYCQSVDVWCLGVFLYEVLDGRTPFFDRERDEMFRRIEQEPVNFSKRFSETAKDLIGRLLFKEPSDRPTLDEVKAHKFYEGINWDKVKTKEVWSHGIYTANEQKEIGRTDIGIINTEKYKNLSVEDGDGDMKIHRVRKIGQKKAPTTVLPGFFYTSPEIVEEERRRVDERDRQNEIERTEQQSGSNAEETARRIMEQATAGSGTQGRNRTFQPMSLRSLREVRRKDANVDNKGRSNSLSRRTMVTKRLKSLTSTYKVEQESIT